MSSNKYYIDGPTLRGAFDEFLSAWQSKLDGQQNIPTFRDQELKAAFALTQASMSAMAPDADLGSIIDSLTKVISRWDVERLVAQIVDYDRGRFIPYDERQKVVKSVFDTTDVGFLTEHERHRSFAMSQGRFDCVSWKGENLYKTAFDMAIYQMLIWELKPRTIIEIGSGNGASAVWMADLAKAFAIDCEIFSLDINSPRMKSEDVNFLVGDCNFVQDVFTDELLVKLPHPWLVVEDAHINVHGVLSHLHRHISVNDYLIVEDWEDKSDEIARFIGDYPESYRVDTYYCDYFGRNVTCSQDSILRRVS